ncbi:MAG: nitroreductase family deazaflavin-dependent oxidoreductase [Anaerolineales bacterium]
MTEPGKHTVDRAKLLPRLAGEEYCYLITTGRLSGRPHQIEIWFGIQNNTLYLLSGGGEGSDWVKNLIKHPSVTVRIANYTFSGTARIVSDAKEDILARQLLAAKYQGWRAGRPLSEWARTALPVAIDFHGEE